jgi:hypothetical protein
MNVEFLGAKPLSWAFESVKRRGLAATCKVAMSAAMDMGFDLVYGTDTIRWVHLKTLNIESAQQGNARYRRYQIRPLRRLMNKLDLPKDGVFVDLGSGKGRVLLIAAQFGFGG